MLKQKLKKIVPVTYSKLDYTLDEVTEIINRTIPKVMLDYEVQLVEHCNLNCSSCSHFSPLAKPEFLSVEEYEKDCKRLSFLFNKKANFIRLMGGEPLLHKDINKFLIITRKYFPDAIIDLDTNGILVLKKNETFFKTMSENNINLSITKYPISLDYDSIKNKCLEYNVNFRFFDNTGDRLFNHLPLDLEGRGSIEKNFLKCYLANCCHTLKHGKMYTCSTIPHIDHFNKFFNKNIKITEDDYIDIYKVNSKEEILNFLAKPVPFCRYCKVFERTSGHKFKKSKKDIGEWI